VLVKNPAKEESLEVHWKKSKTFPKGGEKRAKKKKKEPKIRNEEGRIRDGGPGE